MTTKKIVQLSESEKTLFRKILRTRLWIALFFGVPLIAGIGFMTYQFIDYQIDVFTGEILNADWDFGSYIFFFFLIFCHAGFWFYFVPLYRKSFKNRLQTQKIVATTAITNIVKKHGHKGAIYYTIQTEYVHIDTYTQIILTPIIVSELQQGMTIEIHHLENNFWDIIKIEVIK